jgi:integral membrane sensor domain MASE1
MLKKFIENVRLLFKHFYLVISVVYGLLIIFCCIGAILGRGYFPVAGLVLTCVMWVSSRIVKEASVSFKLLTMLLKGEIVDSETEENEEHKDN